MSSGLHSSIVGADIHVPYRQVFANSTARTGDATVYTVADLYKTALQLDTATVYYLSSYSPTTWTAITASGSGEANTGSNVGAGAAIFKTKTGVDLVHRTIVGGTRITATENTNDVTIATTAEINTASNVGSGSGLWKDKSGSDLRFKSLVAGSGITLTPNTDDVTIAASGGSSFDQRDVLLYDHFITGSVLTERMGIYGWVVDVSGTGADLTFLAEAGHPGILDFGGGSTSAGRAGVYLGNTSVQNFLLGTTQNQIDLEFLFRVNSTALSAVNLERLCIGFGDTFDAASGTEQTNGIYLEYNPSLSAKMRLVTSNGGTKTRTTSSGADVVAATWYRVVIRMTYPGGTPTATLLVNGTSVASHTTNIPTAGLGIGARLDSNAGTEPRFQLDYMLCTQVTSKET